MSLTIADDRKQQECTSLWSNAHGVGFIDASEEEAARRRCGFCEARHVAN
jgi:hypothetical protein